MMHITSTTQQKTNDALCKEQSMPNDAALYIDRIGNGVGTLKDGYVRNVPLPQVPRIQSAKLIAPSRCIPEGTTLSRCIPVGTPLPEYLPISRWIPTLPKLGSLLGFSQRVLWPFSPIAIKAKNNLLS